VDTNIAYCPFSLDSMDIFLSSLLDIGCYVLPIQSVHALKNIVIQISALI
jgi:hypothetical protein